MLLLVKKFKSLAPLRNPQQDRNRGLAKNSEKEKSELWEELGGAHGCPAGGTIVCHNKNLLELQKDDSLRSLNKRKQRTSVK